MPDRSSSPPPKDPVERLAKALEDRSLFRESKTWWRGIAGAALEETERLGLLSSPNKPEPREALIDQLGKQLRYAADLCPNARDYILANLEATLDTQGSPDKPEGQSSQSSPEGVASQEPSSVPTGALGSGPPSTDAPSGEGQVERLRAALRQAEKNMRWMAREAWSGRLTPQEVHKGLQADANHIESVLSGGGSR